MTQPDRAAKPDRVLLDLDQSLINRMFRAVNRAAEPFVETVGAKHGLSINDWRVLRTIAFAPGLSQQGVSARSGLDKMTISRAVNRLVGWGQVSRTSDPQDGRRFALDLTTKGWATYDAIVPQAQERERSFFANLSDADREALSGLVDKLLDES